MAKEILVLGAGMVSRPLVAYLMDTPGFRVTVASRTVAKAEALVRGHKQGVARALNVDDAKALEAAVAAADLVVSLVPYIYHVGIAEHCLKHKKHLVTTSYVSPAMRALDGRAKEAGVLFLNEIGLDPGIDHMSAMKVIHAAQAGGGKVTRFHSYCGGLPAPEANTNPWGYKFSWSPRAVVLAGRNTARYLVDGKKVTTPGEKLFADVRPASVPGAGDFECYPNRDSVPYVETYGVAGVRDMMRGTLRNAGWCETWLKMAALGFLADAKQSFAGMKYRDFTARVVGARAGEDAQAALAAKAGLAADSPIVGRLAWLGLFGDDAVPVAEGAPLDVLAARLLEKCPYAPGERDMIVLHHEFTVEHAGGKAERLTSTLVDFGIPNGDSAMARTVSLPAAIGVRMVLEGKLAMTGVHIPVTADIYEPVLAELETLGIKCVERVLT